MVILRIFLTTALLITLGISNKLDIEVNKCEGERATKPYKHTNKECHRKLKSPFGIGVGTLSCIKGK